MLNKIFQAAVLATLAAAAAGQLPRMVQSVRIAQLQLLKDSESKKWGRPFMLPVQNAKYTKPRSVRWLLNGLVRLLSDLAQEFVRFHA